MFFRCDINLAMTSLGGGGGGGGGGGEGENINWLWDYRLVQPISISIAQYNFQPFLPGLICYILGAFVSVFLALFLPACHRVHSTSMIHGWKSNVSCIYAADNCGVD